jgi:hypothetical protein
MKLEIEEARNRLGQVGVLTARAGDDDIRTILDTFLRRRAPSSKRALGSLTPVVNVKAYGVKDGFRRFDTVAKT